MKSNEELNIVQSSESHAVKVIKNNVNDDKDALIMSLNVQLHQIKQENEQLLIEQSCLFNSNNSRQKVHYLSKLKKQISDLLHENNSLRAKVNHYVISGGNGSKSSFHK